MHHQRAISAATLVLLLICAAAPAHGTTAAATAAPPPPPQQQQPPSITPPLSTRGRHIVDATGAPVRLRCASWSGAQEKWRVNGGLDRRPARAIARMAREAGFNCVRLLWTVELVAVSTPGWANDETGGGSGTNSSSSSSSSVVSASGGHSHSQNSSVAVVPLEAVAANPDLAGKTPLQVLDAVIAAAAAEGLLIVLDNHSSGSGWCCNIDDGEGMWYTNQWSEGDWLRATGLMAERYANVSAVVGFGLRNEPRPAVVGGALRAPLWGSGGPRLDLAAAYERAAAAVVAARPASLVFVQGLLGGRDLRGARRRPLVLRAGGAGVTADGTGGRPVTDKLVYEVHEYGFLPWYGKKYNFSSDAYRSRLDAAWGWAAREGAAPVWVGEFGTAHNADGVEKSEWFQAFTRYIRDLDLGFCYWPLDGTQGPSRALGAEEPYGLLARDWASWAYEPLLQALQAL